MGFDPMLLIVPVLICAARITDVTIGTLRIIYVSKGMKFASAFLGFFEVIIWLIAIGQIMQNLTNWVNYVAYGLGFAIGNYVGIHLEERISIGFVVLRIITRRTAVETTDYLESEGHRYTIIDADSEEGPVNIIYMPLKRKEVKGIVRNVRRYNPKAAYTVEDLRSVSGQFKPDNGPGVTRRRKYYNRYRMLPRTKKK